LKKAYALGYKNQKLSISYEGTSCNNNLSILWRDDVEINHDLYWSPLLGRNIKTTRIAQLKYRIFDNKSILQIWYKKISRDYNISLNEYKLLIAIKLGVFNVEKIISLIGLASKEDVVSIYKNLVSKGYLELSKNVRKLQKDSDTEVYGVDIDIIDHLNKNLYQLIHVNTRFEMEREGFRKSYNNKYFTQGYHPRHSSNYEEQS
jgi:hypothetical protein